MASTRAGCRHADARLLKAFGQRRCMADWLADERCLVTEATLYARLQRGWPVERALSEPPKRGRTDFWSLVQKGDGCWLWLGRKDERGYGYFCVGSKRDGDFASKPAHRIAYESVRGPIPPGLHLDHLCRNPPCVRPNHLEAVTPAENTRRRFTELTHCKRGHELTPENVKPKRGGSGRQCRQCFNDGARARWSRRQTGRAGG